MKGITPIISIIILLLITVGLAASAWSYMSTYMGTLTAKVIEISTQKCVNGEDAMAILHNIGTQSITINNDIVIMEGETVKDAHWCELTESGTCSPEKTSIESGGYAKATISGCCTTGTDCPKTCTYDFIITGRIQTVTVYCPGQ